MQIIIIYQNKGNYYYAVRTYIKNKFVFLNFLPSITSLMDEGSKSGIELDMQIYYET